MFDWLEEKMVDIPRAGLLLAGFVLAHAAWSISDVDETLVPLGVVERNATREIVRVEAGTQAEAISKGKSLYGEWTKTSDAWAFAREGLFRTADTQVDALVVDFWATGMSKPATIIQRFEPFGKNGHFRITGDLEIAIEGSIQTGDKAGWLLNKMLRFRVATAISLVEQGISSHQKVAPIWKKWRDR
jgi:hypothetical protein